MTSRENQEYEHVYDLVAVDRAAKTNASRFLRPGYPQLYQLYPSFYGITTHRIISSTNTILGEYLVVYSLSRLSSFEQFERLLTLISCSTFQTAGTMG